MGEYDPGTGQEALRQIRESVIEPPLFRVLLLNDDYTTMEFVVEVLMVVFHKPVATATRIMLDVHKRGSGVCGTFTHDIAETKVETVHALAREKGFPLKCIMERE